MHNRRQPRSRRHKDIGQRPGEKTPQGGKPNQILLLLDVHQINRDTKSKYTQQLVKGQSLDQPSQRINIQSRMSIKVKSDQSTSSEIFGPVKVQSIAVNTTLTSQSQ